MAVADFFVLRTPYLPAHALTALGAQLESDAGQPDADTLDRDRARTRQFLLGLFSRPDIAEALYLASPSLSREFDRWRTDPTPRVDMSLLSYASRMMTRATPFGLFAGLSLGEVASDTELRLAAAESYRRFSGLDCGYLNEAGLALQALPEVTPNVTFTVNTSLYPAHERLRYLRTDGRAVELVALVPDAPLVKILHHAAAPGHTPRALGKLLQECDDTITEEEADEYIATLIDEQVLVGGLTGLVTGPDPLDALIDGLSAASAPESVLEPLLQARSLLRELDNTSAGAGLAHIHAIAEALRALPTPVDSARLVRCHLHKPADARISAALIDDIHGAVDLLDRIGDPIRHDPLQVFAAVFSRRYGDREVPLCEVLDQECGIGFPDGTPVGRVSTGDAQLLEGLRFPATNEPAIARYTQRDSIVAGWLFDAAREGRSEVVLTSHDVAELERATPRVGSPPDSYGILATVLGRDSQSINRGAYQIIVSGVAGPSGANLLGRYCREGDALTDKVRSHLRGEEVRHPDAIFAEVVHLPEPRLGNVLARPVLREYEIPFLGRSGAKPERQILPVDLLVSVRAGRVTLRSASDGREVIPRLTTAHNFNGSGNIPLYRFLCSLQRQGTKPWLPFSFGALQNAPFLPRVSSGRYILSRARWNVGDADLKALRDSHGAARFAVMRALRRARGIPRWVAVGDGDRMLTVDLANAVFVDVVADWARKHSTLTFTEVFLNRDHLPVTGPEGRYLHEIVVPTQGAGLLPSQSAVIPHPADVRLCGRHAPGSEWLYVKLYAGPAGVETLLREVARPVIADALRALAVDRWFFVRYGDPDWHIRLRMHGDPERLLTEVLPALTARCDRYLRSGLIWRIQVDTYEPEVERYGGLAGMWLAEAVFCADSEAVLRTIEFDCGEDVPARWRSALVGVDRLLCDLGLDHQDRHDIVTDAVTRFEQQLRVDTQLRRQLGARYRRERTGLEHLLRAPGSCAAFSQRTAALSTVRDQLHEAVPPQHLSRWVGSLTHMHLNRMLRTPTSQQEFVIYDLLHRHYKSLRARVQRQI